MCGQLTSTVAPLVLTLGIGSGVALVAEGGMGCESEEEGRQAGWADRRREVRWATTRLEKRRRGGRSACGKSEKKGKEEKEKRKVGWVG